MVNDKQWQDNSDGWVTAMNKSKDKKRKHREAQHKLDSEVCKHGDLEWCDFCAVDMDGNVVAQKGIDY